MMMRRMMVVRMNTDHKTPNKHSDAQGTFGRTKKEPVNFSGIDRPQDRLSHPQWKLFQMLLDGQMGHGLWAIMANNSFPNMDLVATSLRGPKISPQATTSSHQVWFVSRRTKMQHMSECFSNSVECSIHRKFSQAHLVGDLRPRPCCVWILNQHLVNVHSWRSQLPQYLNFRGETSGWWPYQIIYCNYACPQA